MNRSVIILISTLVLGYVFKANANEEEFLISNESFLNLRDGEVDQHLVKRAAPKYTLSDSEIASILDMHNTLRGQTKPTASNMEYMLWDSELASMAQEWNDGCKFAHGNPHNSSPFKPVGQNIFVAKGTKSNPVQGSTAVQSWYDEDKLYTYASNSCHEKDACGHYTQVVWASSKYVGCGMTFCPLLTGAVSWENTWMITCNYGPAGNIVGAKPFLQGAPCTQCDSFIGQCYNNKCRLCSTHSEKCECKQVCVNGGVLDATKCSCKCADGFYGADCSRLCKDTSTWCGVSNRWPKHLCKYEDEYPDVVRGCPLMCGKCNKLPCSQSCYSKGGTLDEETCVCKCNEGFQGEDCKTCAKKCKHGGTLNPESCECNCVQGFTGVECEQGCRDKNPFCSFWSEDMCDDEIIWSRCKIMCGLCVPPPAREMQLTDENIMDEFQ